MYNILVVKGPTTENPKRVKIKTAKTNENIKALEKVGHATSKRQEEGRMLHWIMNCSKKSEVVEVFSDRKLKRLGM